MMRVFGMAALLAAMTSGSALAAANALVVANGDYDDLPDVSGADRVLSAEAALDDAGIAVVQSADGTSEELRTALSDFANALGEETDRAAAILSGRFVHTGAETYLLPVDAAEPLSVADVVTGALPLSAVLGLLAEYPGRAVLMVAESDADARAGGQFLGAGIGRVDLPQGVTLVRGTPRAIGRLASGALAEADADVMASARDANLDLDGFVPRALVFATEALAAERAASAPKADGDTGDDRLWQSVRARDDQAGYETYLDAYPDGAHAAEARERIAALADAPRRAAEQEEAALGLSQAQRQDVQGDLTALGFDTRGVDGIFGAGSRDAISRWQAQNGAEATGYLTAAQVDRIATQAARAEAEAAAGADAERQRAGEAERAYWRELGDTPDADALRGYLDRFPNGANAEAARARLDLLEGNAAQQRLIAARDAFAVARDRNTVEAYRAFLDEYPQGEFADRARRRIDALQQTPGGGSESAGPAAAEEQALSLPQPARAIAEQRLRELGFDPGQVDGTFNEQTRAALRGYQSDRGLPATGYLDRATASQLLQESIFGR